jgi:hypothetical protein
MSGIWAASGADHGRLTAPRRVARRSEVEALRGRPICGQDLSLEPCSARQRGCQGSQRGRRGCEDVGARQAAAEVGPRVLTASAAASTWDQISGKVGAGKVGRTLHSSPWDCRLGTWHSCEGPGPAGGSAPPPNAARRRRGAASVMRPSTKHGAPTLRRARGIGERLARRQKLWVQTWSRATLQPDTTAARAPPTPRAVRRRRLARPSACARRRLSLRAQGLLKPSTKAHER